MELNYGLWYSHMIMWHISSCETATDFCNGELQHLLFLPPALQLLTRTVSSQGGPRQSSAASPPNRSTSHWLNSIKSTSHEINSSTWLYCITAKTTWLKWPRVKVTMSAADILSSKIACQSPLSDAPIEEGISSRNFVPLLEISTSKYVPLQEICTPKYSYGLLVIWTDSKLSQLIESMQNYLIVVVYKWIEKIQNFLNISNPCASTF